ncbi:polysaccharide pyruvyl transferase family protein [Acetivibrio mesophilus]|uniref:Polysaccharide pyruvyl transferase family protein n=1 Tax=Acetivibrio mesophilus TaxID=2487273 RepID=A0A4Q0I376_9FIRM|nr:polysaccharide pyruvyl transferase family protein [Acetivibrio mesophilus]RXE58678.1 polysaccharide pyruvyl transferase family protein [Acetivibrio mesophilus]
MKKIAILTFHRAINYGACLQAYALKHTIEEYGIKCDILDYRCTEIESFYNKIYRHGNSVKTTLKNLLTWHVQRKRNHIFTQFTDRYLLDGSKRSYTRENIGEANKEYDLFIVGSDQVWAPLCTGKDETYFLDFVTEKEKKYSYAACLGVVDYNFLGSQHIKNLLEDFSKISVREESSIQILQNTLNEDKAKDIVQSVDPTFLLSKEEWLKVAQPVGINNYIFVYSLSMPEEVVDYAQQLQKATGLQLVFCTLDNLFTVKNRKNVVTVSPTEFLGYILNANFVVTNSFHGTAFSIIFNKEFVTIKNSNPNHDNSRLIDILNICKLQDRLLSNGEKQKTLSKIDYDYVNRTIQNLRKGSIDYLNSIVSQCKS